MQHACVETPGGAVAQPAAAAAAGTAGYARVLLTLGALACARRRPLLCAGAYFFA
jgi:hypothetical protein